VVLHQQLQEPLSLKQMFRTHRPLPRQQRLQPQRMLGGLQLCWHQLRFKLLPLAKPVHLLTPPQVPSVLQQARAVSKRCLRPLLR